MMKGPDESSCGSITVSPHCLSNIRCTQPFLKQPLILDVRLAGTLSRIPFLANCRLGFIQIRGSTGR